MFFNNNDIEEILNYSSNNQSGSYNQLQWSVHPGSDYTDISAHVVSIHEFLHNELNNITAYGFLLQGYAYLSREDSEKKDFYCKTLIQLINKCRLSHESYATWVGLTVFKRSISNNLQETILKNNNEYRQYYDDADYLVRNINSIFLKQQVVTACVRFCFQSQKIADYGI